MNKSIAGIAAVFGIGILLLQFTGDGGGSGDAPARSAALETEGPEGLVGSWEFDSARIVEVGGDAVGEWVELGFAVGGMTRARVESDEVHDDGRRSLGLRLPNGEGMFVSIIGEEWRAMVLPRAGGNGWSITGSGTLATVREMKRSAMICASDDRPDEAGLPAISTLAGEGPAEGPLPEVGESLAPLSSFPEAVAVIYLDFDGETVSGTLWNSSYTGGSPINAAASGFTDAMIRRVWEGVAEDFRPFGVNVTTDRALFEAAPLNRRTMVVFTPSNEWYGTSGGVAYIDVFGSTFYDLPAWVFTDQLMSGGSPSASYAAEAASHEAGHTLGLHHDGTGSTTYYGGHGSGATKWAAIMGSSYSAAISQWSKGEYAGANNSEDDLAIISNTKNGIGYRTDDHGNSRAAASELTESGTGEVSGEGFIHRRDDVDVFSFSTSGGAVSLAVNNDPSDPNLDVGLRLLNSSGAVLATSDLLTSSDATIATTLGAGTYYLEVDGVGTGDPTTGYSDYASLGGYTVSGTVPYGVILAAEILSPSAAEVSVTEGVGLVVEGAVDGGSPGWSIVSAPAGETVEFSSAEATATRLSFGAAGEYVIRLTCSSGVQSVSRDLTVSVEEAGSPPAFAARAPGVDLGSDRSVFSDRVSPAAVVTDDGPSEALAFHWSVISGSGTLSSASAAGPELSFAAAGPLGLRLEVSDGDIRSFDEVELTAHFGPEQLMSAGAGASAMVPVDGSLGTDWTSLNFDDAAWRTGFIGAGYDVNSGGASNRIYLPIIGEGLNVGDEMYQKESGCYLRVPFNVVTADTVLSLILRMNYDDGFVAYLNGIEVARANVPSGVPDWNTRASADRADASALVAGDFPIALEPGMLLNGVNVLAIHGMNAGVGTGDREFVILPVLEAVVADVPYLSSVAGIADPGLRGELIDADDDGRSNLAEHAAGTNPAEMDDAYAMIGVVDENHASVIMPADPPVDIRYEIEATSDFVEPWTSIARRDGGGDWELSEPVSTEVIGPLLKATFPVPTEASRFFRLKITRIAP